MTTEEGGTLNTMFIFIIVLIIFMFTYSMVVVGKQADRQLRIITENQFRGNNLKLLEDKMESQREVLRTIENEIRKGSTPLHFEELGFAKDTYHLVESQAKLNQLLDYFFRNGEYAALADRQIKSNVYMDILRRKPVFRNAKSELDRRNMEVAVKQWIQKKHPSFDGDVYVENVRCFFSLPEHEIEKRQCRIDGADTAALIFSKKHLAALYLQCSISRKEVMQHTKRLEGFSEECNQIYRLENVDVLFQCLLMDKMDWEDGRAYVHFSTVYLLEKNRIFNV